MVVIKRLNAPLSLTNLNIVHYHFKFLLIEMWPNSHLFLVCYYLVLVACSTDELEEVVFVNMLFRHGDRNPIKLYPTDPYKNSTLWSEGWGELTNIGKRGHYELGKWLRKRYSQLLPNKYNKDDIYIMSTDVDRTLMSAYSNLAGLYEPDLKSNWNPNIKWTPIPVHTVPEHLDWVLAGKAPCPKYDLEYKELLNSPEFKIINEENKGLYNYLTIHTGRNITSVIDVEEIYDTLFIEELRKLTLPYWAKDVFPQPMKKISEFTFSLPCYTHSLARLKIGPLLGEMLNHMQKKVLDSEKFKKKIWMYSAHDVTVANVLKALGLFQPQCPPYYSLILFELRKKNGDYYVAIHYKNSTSVPPYFMQLEGCDKLCPFDKFQSIVSSLIPKNWEQECKAIRFVENIYDSAASISLITILTVALILLFSLGIAIKFYKTQRWNEAEFAYKSMKLEISS